MSGEPEKAHPHETVALRLAKEVAVATEERDAALAEVKDLKFAITTWQAQVEMLKADKTILDWLEEHRNCSTTYDPGDPEVGVSPQWSVDKHIGKPGENLWDTVAFGETLREAVNNAMKSANE